MAAFIAKPTAGWIQLPTFRADKFQFIATLIAKSRVFGILMLAVWAFHFFPERLDSNF